MSDFYLVSSDYCGFETPRACSIVKEVDIPVFSGKGLLVEISPPIIGQTYGFGCDDIHRIVITQRFAGESLAAIDKWPCHVHVLCPSSTVNGEVSPDKQNLLHIACAEIYRSETECNLNHAQI